MMGKQDRQEALFTYNVNLNDRVRADHPLRQVIERIDFSFARQEVKDLYGANGNVSVDPETILKMMFLLYFDDVKSERLLMRVIRERMDYLWFLGYGLDDEIPNHSVLSKARARWGSEVFERLFVQTIAQCVEAELVDGDKLHMDSSLVDADASKDSVVKGSPEIIRQLKKIYKVQEKKLDEQTLARVSASAANRQLMSRTDPDAPVVHRKGIGSRPRYKTHRGVDDKHGVITATTTTPGDVADGVKLMELVEQHERNTDRRVNTVVADSLYGTVDNFRQCRRRSIRSHMADLREKQKRKKKAKEGFFDESAFEYDAAADTYICPAGQRLHRRKHSKTRRVFIYSAGGETCGECPLKSRCTDALARTVSRHEDSEEISCARAESASPLAKRDRRRRKHLMEGSFADGANNHHLKRSRWRRLWRQRIQDYLIAVSQNIRILLGHAGGRRAEELAESVCVCLLRLFVSVGVFFGLASQLALRLRLRGRYFFALDE